MNDAQVWSIIAVLAATLVSMVVGMFTLFSRTMKAEFGSVRAEFGTVRAEIAGLRKEVEARFDAVDVRFDATDRRIDSMDRDLQIVFNRLFGNQHDQL